MSFLDRLDDAYERYKARHRNDERLVTDECECPACRSDMAGLVPCQREPKDIEQ
ncbi:hypothetical protein TomTYG75_06720 [Sphingobium sp. TomTYG75]